jgi:hypothetical protein
MYIYYKSILYIGGERIRQNPKKWHRMAQNTEFVAKVLEKAQVLV